MPSKPDVKRISDIPAHPPIKPAVISEPQPLGLDRVEDVRLIDQAQEEPVTELAIDGESVEQPKPTAVTAKRWVVQVASYVSREEADKLAKRIVDETDQVSFVKTVVINGNKHRVYVGPFLTRNDSIEAKKQIDSLYSVDSLILMHGARG